MPTALGAACLLNTHYFLNVVLNWVALAVIFHHVVLPYPSNKIKLFLSFYAFQEVESHIIWFCTFWYHVFGDEALCCCVICGNRCFGLVMYHLLQEYYQWYGWFAIVEQFCNLCLWSWGNHVLNNIWERQDCSIVEVLIVDIGEVVMSVCSAFWLWFWIILCIWAQSQYHITG